MDKLTKNSAEYIVYNKIKNAIINKLLTPGTQLIEQTLSDKFNVSRTPIRNAFKRLEEEGFVINIPYRGTFIIQPGKEEIMQAYQVRIELECLAIQFGLNNIDDGDIENLKLLLDKEIEALRNNNIIEYIEINKEFHLYLAKVSKNKFLVEFLDKMLDQINVYLILYDTYHNLGINEINSIPEHEAIINLIEQKNIEELVKYTRFHLNMSLVDLNLDKIINKSIENIF